MLEDADERLAKGIIERVGGQSLLTLEVPGTADAFARPPDPGPPRRAGPRARLADEAARAGGGYPQP
jgi:hypothetical protein